MQVLNQTKVMPNFKNFLDFGIANYYASEEGREAYLSALVSFCKAYTESPNTDRHPLYQKSVDKANSLKLHLRNDQKIGGKIRERRPTEHAESTEYREKAFEPITYSHSQTWLDYLTRVFHESIHDVSHAEIKSGLLRDGESLADYIKTLPNYGMNLTGYAQEYQLGAMSADPNGWHGVTSKKAVSELDPNELPEPVPNYVPSEAVIYYRSTEFLFVLSKEKNEIRNGDYTDYGNTFWVFDPFNTYKIIQTGKGAKMAFDVILWDSHFFGTIPMQQNKGRTITDEEFFLQSSPFFEYDSIFAPAIPYLNKALNLSSDLDVNLVLHAFLQKIEYQQPCNVCHSTGQISLSTEADGWATCPECNGSRFKKASLFDVYQVGTEHTGGITGDVPTVAKYVDLPLEVIEVLAKRESYYLEEAYKRLGLGSLISPATIQAQTAEAKKLDKDPALIFFKKVAGLLYNSIQFLSDWINILRYSGVIPESLEENRSIYRAPVNFEVETAKEIFGNLQLLKDSGAYETMAKEYLKQAARVQFGGESSSYLRVKALLELDPLFGKDEGTILAARSNGDISEGDAILHFNIAQYIAKAIEETDNFLTLETNEQREIVRAFI